MQIFKLTQNEIGGYDIYTGCVVIAESAELARNMHPAGGSLADNADDWIKDWPSNAEHVSVELVGEALDSETEARVVLSSFRPG